MKIEFHTKDLSYKYDSMINGWDVYIKKRKDTEYKFMYTMSQSSFIITLFHYFTNFKIEEYRYDQIYSVFYLESEGD